MDEPLFDMEQATEMLESFGVVSGLGATLFVPDFNTNTVQVLYSDNACEGKCIHCVHRIEGDLNAWSASCQKTHCTAAEFSERFAGRYFYQCADDRLFFATPIVIDSLMVAAITIGPVDIFEADDNDSEAESAQLDAFPVCSPKRVQDLANILSACGISIGDSTQSNLQLMRQINMTQQRQIHASIQATKQNPLSDYPIELENRLVKAIEDADVVTARTTLNDLLGTVSAYYLSHGIKIDGVVNDLMVVCSRAALNAGVLGTQVIEALIAYRSELARLKKSDQICFCMQRFVERMAFMVSRLRDVNYEDDIYRAIGYIRANYNKKIMLNDVASAVGFSPAYFSRLFKKKVGSNFNTYLNTVRIEAAKNSLLSTDLTVAEIASLSGFEDVSYFTRIFKRQVGVAPGHFRSRRGQVGKSKSRSK